MTGMPRGKQTNIFVRMTKLVRCCQHTCDCDVSNYAGSMSCVVCSQVSQLQEVLTSISNYVFQGGVISADQDDTGKISHDDSVRISHNDTGRISHDDSKDIIR